MAGVPPGMELCPYCRKPFKRLKSHLPHCKMAGDKKTAFDVGKVASSDLKASHSKPLRLLAPEKKRGQSKENITTPDNSSERESKKKSLGTIGIKAESKLTPLQRGGTAGPEIASNLPAETPGKNTKRQIKLSSEKTHRDEGMTVVQEEARMHMNAAEERTSKAKHAKQLPTKQKSRSKNTSHDENSAPGGILELSSLNKDEKSASKFPNDPIRVSAKQKQRKVGSPTQEVAGVLDLTTCDLESIPRAAIEGVEVVIEKHRVKVLRGRNESKIQGKPADSATTGDCTTQGWYLEMLAPDCSESHADTVQSDHWKNVNGTGAMNTNAFSLKIAESNTLSGEREKGSRLTAAEMHVLSDPDCRKSPHGLIPPDRVAKSETEEKQFYLNGDVDSSKASFSASLAEKPHPTVRETLRGASEGIASNYLACVQQFVVDEKQIALLSESVLNTGRRDSELALKPHVCHTSENQPTCPFQSSGRNIQARSIGLEWFPELYPNYQKLSMFPGRPLQVDTEIKVKKIEPGFLEGPQAPLVERRLMDVKLRELPAWLAACDFSPKGLLGAVQKAWSSYYNKYIDVKKGGAAGISMMLAGYCILSYGWRYEHTKQDRWRRYH
uniref:Chromosome 17 open reading frame 80 n=1 Tax=Chelydra serpentina TaxID=8475 RepID=A0A8C3T6G6_CHESE